MLIKIQCENSAECFIFGNCQKCKTNHYESVKTCQDVACFALVKPRAWGRGVIGVKIPFF